MTNDSSAHQKSEMGAPIKQGAAIGGWICFALGTLVMYWSVWAFILYVPLFFVAFVLSIVAMSQRRIVLGLVLLLSTIIIPLIEWFTLAATRTNKFLDEHGAPKVNLFNTPAPIAPNRTPSEPNPSPSFRESPTTKSQPASDAEQTTRDRVIEQPLDMLHAWQMQVAYNGFLAANPITAPAFSPDGESVVFAQQANNSVMLAIYRLRDHRVTKSWRPNAVPKVITWSPDMQRLAYRAEDAVHLVEMASGRDFSLPINYFFGTYSDPLVWKSSGELAFDSGDLTYRLDLDSLRVTQSQSRNRDQGIKSNRDHQFCRVFQDQVGNGAFLFVGERDGSYAHVLLERFFAQTQFFVSPDLRHILIYQNNFLSQSGSITHLMLGSRPAPNLMFQIDLDIMEGGVHDGAQTGPEKYLQLGVPFWADVCSPSTNPLNGKIVGPNTNNLKGRVRVMKWGNKIAIVRTALELAPIRDEDIACNIQSEQWGQFGNWAWSFPGVWKVLKRAASNEVDRAKTETDGSLTASFTPAATESPSASVTVGDSISSSTISSGEQGPGAQTHVFAAEELQNWSAEKVQNAINEIFARHGAVFPDRSVQESFERFAWYHPQPGLSFDQIEASLREVERQNVQVLGKIRNAKRNPSISKLFAGKWKGALRMDVIPMFGRSTVYQDVYLFEISEDENSITLSSREQLPVRWPVTRTGRTLSWQDAGHSADGSVTGQGVSTFTVNADGKTATVQTNENMSNGVRVTQVGAVRRVK